jgi:ribosome-associated translation inhibitor RaiA
MHYSLSSNHIHVSPRTSALLDRRMKTLGRHLPARLKNQSLHVSLHENLSRNFVEGVAYLPLPHKTLIAKYKGNSINEVIQALVDRMRIQVVAYKATHDAWHSDYPDKRSIRTAGQIVS